MESGIGESLTSLHTFALFIKTLCAFSTPPTGPPPPPLISLGLCLRTRPFPPDKWTCLKFAVIFLIKYVGNISDNTLIFLTGLLLQINYNYFVGKSHAAVPERSNPARRDEKVQEKKIRIGERER